MNYDGVIVILNYTKNSVDLIKYNQSDLDNSTFDEYLETIGYDVSGINYFVADEVAVRQYRIAEKSTLVRGAVTYY